MTKEAPQEPQKPISPQEWDSFIDAEVEWQDKTRWEAEWNRQKVENHLANLNILHGVFYKGVFYHNGNGQKKG